jgi:hypothetical protein
MSQGRRDAGFVRRRRGGAAFLVIVVLAGMALLASAPVASASSQDNVWVATPSSYAGPVDTLLTVNVNEYSGAAYTLSVTTTSPDNGGCANELPIPGLGPIPTDAQRGGTVTFRWPVSLGHGQYYFCADPVSGGGAQAKSHLAYTVLNDADPAVQFSPSSVVQAGSSVTFQLANWVTSDGATPPLVGLLAQKEPFSAILTQGQAEPNGPGDAATGSHTYTITIAPGTPAGVYTLVVESECGNGIGASGGDITPCPVMEQSDFFALLAAPTPTLAPLGTQAHTVNQTPSILSGGNPGNLNPPPDNTLWYIGGAGAGLAGIAGAALFFVLRRRRHGL